MKWRALYCTINGEFAYLEGENTSEDRRDEAIGWWSRETEERQWAHWDGIERGDRVWYTVEIDDAEL